LLINGLQLPARVALTGDVVPLKNEKVWSLNYSSLFFHLKKYGDEIGFI